MTRRAAGRAFRTFAPLGLLLLGTVRAQVPLPDAEPADSLDHLFIDFSVPDLAAFTLIGVNGSQISRPGNVRELSVALNNSLTAAGDPAQGVGIEVAPTRVLDPARTVDEYHGLRDRFTLSFGTLREGDTTRLGIGFRWVPVDGADPYESRALRDRVVAALQASQDEGLTTELKNAFHNDVRPFLLVDLDGAAHAQTLIPLFDLNALGDVPDPLTEAVAFERAERVLDALGISRTAAQRETLRSFARRFAALVRLARSVDADADLEARIVAVKKAFRDSTWNAFSLQFAAGVTARSLRADDLRAETFSAFTGLTLPVTRRGQLIVHGQLSLPFDDDALTTYDDGLRASLGGRLLVGSATKRFSLEALYGTNDPRLDGDTNTRFTVGAEFRLSEGVYLELATGLDDPERSAARFLTLGALRYALRQDHRFPTP